MKFKCLDLIKLNLHVNNACERMILASTDRQKTWESYIINDVDVFLVIDYYEFAFVERLIVYSVFDKQILFTNIPINTNYFEPIHRQTEEEHL